LEKGSPARTAQAVTHFDRGWPRHIWIVQGFLVAQRYDDFEFPKTLPDSLIALTDELAPDKIQPQAKTPPA
jgi:hypothetical protein